MTATVTPVLRLTVFRHHRVMGDGTEEIDWEKEIDLARGRFYRLLSNRTDYRPRLQKIAVKDREKYAEYRIVKISPLLNQIRFMVEVCGIPFELAEARAIKDYDRQVKHHLMETTMFNNHYVTVNEGNPPDEVARRMVARAGISDALLFARLCNQARKGTEGATFWNEVVRALRTAQFAKLDKATRRAAELDDADHAKEWRAMVRRHNAEEKAKRLAKRALQDPKSDE